MRFRDRRDAGAALGRLLAERYFAKNIIIYALPRGGVPVAAMVSAACNAPLDILVVRKIGHPHDPEYAVGAMSEDGDVLWEKEESSQVDEYWLASMVEEEQKEAIRRRTLYGQGKKRIKATGKVAVVVDDGAATGLTMRVALMALKKENPTELVAALPVAPHSVIETLKHDADDVVVCEDIMGYFGAVGRFYEAFPQVNDDEVVRILNASAKTK
jgi:predicted phosphoribosyltransferase